MPFVGADARVVTGTTFIFGCDPYSEAGWQSVALRCPSRRIGSPACTVRDQYSGRAREGSALSRGHADCIGWCQQTPGGRRRANTARTYLRPTSKGPHLELVTNALVQRMLFEGTRAIGFGFSRGRQVKRSDRGPRGNPAGGCRRLATPPPAVGCRRSEHLVKLGVPIVYELRGVGRTCRTTMPRASLRLR